jgi:hypothetical protein
MPAEANRCRGVSPNHVTRIMPGRGHHTLFYSDDLSFSGGLLPGERTRRAATLRPKASIRKPNIGWLATQLLARARRYTLAGARAALLIQPPWNGAIALRSARPLQDFDRAGLNRVDPTCDFDE